MKKGKLFTKLAVFGTCLCAPLLLAGCTKESESKVEFRVQDGYIQVTEDGETWKNLVDIDTSEIEYDVEDQDNQVKMELVLMVSKLNSMSLILTFNGDMLAKLIGMI